MKNGQRLALAPPRTSIARRRRVAPGDPSLTREKLLATRICALDLDLDRSPLGRLVRRLQRELKAKGLAFRPKCYLGDEWGCPEGVPAIGIPFYLAHPRLLRIERKEMLTVEGAGEVECMKLLRHEAGHAFNYAFQLHRRRGWRELFGEYHRRYPERYRVAPFSRRYVRHLGHGYAQRHPDEDFAETFAVWLTPGINWRRQYRGTGAITKLEYVDSMARRYADRRGASPPPHLLHGAVEHLRRTLASYYARRRHEARLDRPDAHDQDLHEIFVASEAKGRSAARFLARRAGRLVDLVTHWTGEPKHVVRPLERLLEARVRTLGLRVRPGAEEETMAHLLAYATTLTMNYVYRGRFLIER